MNTEWQAPTWALVLTLTTVLAAAQDVPVTAPAAPPAAPAAKASPSKSSAQIDAGEPRATTSPAEPSSAAAPTPANAAAASTAAPIATPRTRSAKAGQKGPAGNDRLDLGTATVTGDREQPKVMYIVPWKKSDIGDLSGKPMNSLLDEALAPVDRDEFRREVAYYDAVRADAPQNGASPPASPQGEK
jgi:hypothetical protein